MLRKGFSAAAAVERKKRRRQESLKVIKERIHVTHLLLFITVVVVVGLFLEQILPPKITEYDNSS